ncbi:ABC transporter ATP-binding protein [Candidatus Peregrinibacteria bacterium]|nr:ABC transporter ATP-binding protein [Candidatus Peregrinibacteria bacterium]
MTHITAIKIQDLHKIYHKGTYALKGFNLEIKQGEFFALLGPNGGGKSTLINIMAGPTKKTSGTIKICGLNIDTHREETKSMLGIVPQEVNFDSFFDVNEVLTQCSGYYGIKNNQKYIDEILEKLNLHDKKFANTRFLSGGMKRRLLIAKALVHKPKVLVLDEPTAGVDVELRHNLWTYLRQLNKDGLTILLTTHYLEEAENLCKRTAIIHQGRLVALDETKKLVRSLGNYKEMTLNFKEKIGKIPAALENFQAKKISDYDLSLNFEPKDLNKVLEALKGLNPADIELQSQDLEDVFLKLTYKNNG